MSHGNYQVITFINQDNNRTASWMGKWVSRSATSSLIQEPIVAQQIRNWIPTQSIWRIASDVKRNLSNDLIDQFRAQGVIEGSLSKVQSKLASLLPTPVDPNQTIADNIISDLHLWDFPTFFKETIDFYLKAQITPTEFVNAWEFLKSQGTITLKPIIPPPTPPPIPPPDDPPIIIQNTAFTLTYSDGFSKDYVLDTIESQKLADWQVANSPLPIEVGFNNVRDTDEKATHTFIQVINDLEKKVAELRVTPPEDTISTDMVSQSIGAFKIENDRLTGDILYIANSVFNPFWYSKEIKSVIEVRDESNTIIITKANSLFFTENERDEKIFIDEFVSSKKVTINFFVTDNTFLSNFSLVKSITVEEGLPPPPDPPTETQGGSDFLTKASILGIGLVIASAVIGKNKRSKM